MQQGPFSVVDKIIKGKCVAGGAFRCRQDHQGEVRSKGQFMV